MTAEKAKELVIRGVISTLEESFEYSEEDARLFISEALRKLRDLL